MQGAGRIRSLTTIAVRFSALGSDATVIRVFRVRIVVRSSGMQTVVSGARLQSLPPFGETPAARRERVGETYVGFYAFPVCPARFD